MVLFQSMQTVTLWTIVTVIALVWFGSRTQPLAVAGAFLRSLWTSRSFLFAFIAMVLILMVNGMELTLEKMLQINWDFTPNIHQLEGQFVYSVQQIFNHPLLTQFVSFFYIVVFQALIVASLGIYTTNGNLRMAHAVCYAIMINYIVAIPFYLFFPVNEVWSYPPSGVNFRMLEVFPNFEEQYRAFSGIDNCFPSLHTSISITVALLASQSGNRRWAIFTAASAVIIVFSIFYLGIHWLTDMLAGTVLATAASWAGLKLAGVQPKHSLLPDRQKTFSKSYSESNEM
ncbi:phosphatase PAP2 family protein [Paenibacillus alvei]|uniref:Inositol phosphorylceramide synthase n=1 Tax=Paenibacillus alvei TaxID=44250 RepID=A0AAP7DI81_PAEAL|nr:phosphatase PAP2 family protein [Paenibacillus alvei]MCY9578997.1 phosphatase PAP2 family protein [Paenibacillus alvei]MCY9583425.1 phosphatase PAP2 family protein [Paenibacillus alvei]NOJ70645.1 inositol phosphorylceramide synthase [Paenibacillus alvei]